MKRTPITRTTPLKRPRGPQRAEGLAPVSRQQRRRIGRYTAARARVIERDGGICQRCGAPGTETHHKAGRIGDRMWDESLLVTLCSGCHRWATENPAEAYASGWLIRRNAVTP